MRRRRLGWPALVLVAALSACGQEAGPERPAPRPAGPRPNVLLLVLDTVRADRCSVLGYGRPTTPALAAWAQDAVVFTNAWGPAGWTGPSHGTLFTGLRPHTSGFLEGNIDFLAPEATTLAEVLAAAGYRTAAFTANEVVSAGYGLLQGFQKVEEYHGRTLRTMPGARAIHEDALEWMQRVHAAGQPFFAFINDMEAHLPYDPLEEFARRFVDPGAPAVDVAYARQFNNPRSDAANLGLFELEAAFLGILSDLYDAEIAMLDVEVGVLLGGLARSGLADSTLVVVVSDHGENLGDHGLVDHKFSLHRSILHVPLLLRYPGRFSGGRRVGELVRLEDVLPTVLEVVGLDPPGPLDGLPLTRDLEGRIARSSWGTWMHFLGTVKGRYPEVDATLLGLSIESVFDGRWHYIHRADGAEELYDVLADPAEAHNLAQRERGEIERLKPLLERQAPPIAVTGSPP